MNSRNKSILVWVSLLLPLLGWWAYGLLDLDEGFYAVVASEMNRTGSWITPLFNGHPWYEKPILLYWFAKPAIAIFGPWIGPRLPSILATLGTYALVQRFGNRFLTKDAGTIAALVLGTSVYFVAIGRMMLVDPLLNLSLACCLLFFWESLQADNPTRTRILSAAGLGLAFLAKGPVGGIFFLLLAIETYAFIPELRPKFKGGWLPAIGVFLLIVASWYLPAYLIDRQVFVQKFIIEQNLARFSGGDEAHTVRGLTGLIYYIPILLVGLLPWIAALWRSARNQEPHASQLRRYLLFWAGNIIVFFTISSAKLPHYVLPAFVPLALLIADQLAKKDFTPKRLTGFAIGAATLAIIANVGFTGYWNAFHAEVQNLTIEVHKTFPATPMAFFSLSRNLTPNPKEQAPTPRLFGKIPISINDTTHPSLFLYINDHALETDQFDELLQQSPLIIITRPGRLPADAQKRARARGLNLQHLLTQTPQIFYRAYRLDK